MDQWSAHHDIIWKVASNGYVVPVLIPKPSTVIPSTGRLLIHVIRARNLYSPRTFGKMCPYVEVKVGQAKLKTKVVQKGGKTPAFNDTLVFELNGEEDEVRIRVYDKTTLGSDIVGTAHVQVDSLLNLTMRRAKAGVLGSPATPSREEPKLADAKKAASGSVPASIIAANQAQAAGAADKDKNKQGAEPVISDAAKEVAVKAGLDGELPPRWFEIGRDTRSQSPSGAVLLACLFTPFTAGNKTKLAVETTPQQVKDNKTPAKGDKEHKQPGRASAMSVPGPLQPVSAHHPVSATLPSPHNAQHPQSHAQQHADQQADRAMKTRTIRRASAAHLQLFGGPLSNGLRRSKSNVPVICFVCVQYLVHHGLEAEGLFRVPGSQQRILELKQSFEKGESVNIIDAHDTAGVLKLYFRELSEPVIPFAHYEAFMQATDDELSGETRRREARGEGAAIEKKMGQILLPIQKQDVNKKAVEELRKRNLEREAHKPKQRAADDSKIGNSAQESPPIALRALSVAPTQGTHRSSVSELPSYFRPESARSDNDEEPDSPSVEEPVKDEKYALLKRCVKKLPGDHYRVLNYLLHFLVQVATKEKINKMDSKNLGMVFGPTLLKQPAESEIMKPAADAQSMVKEMERAKNCISLMIDGYSYIFPDGPPHPFEIHHPNVGRVTLRRGGNHLRHGTSFKDPRKDQPASGSAQPGHAGPADPKAAAQSHAPGSGSHAPATQQHQAAGSSNSHHSGASHGSSHGSHGHGHGHPPVGGVSPFGEKVTILLKPHKPGKEPELPDADG